MALDWTCDLLLYKNLYIQYNTSHCHNTQDDYDMAIYIAITLLVKGLFEVISW